MANMEEQLFHLLSLTQSREEGPRKQAELDLLHARSNPNFPLALAHVGVQPSAPVEIRQAALSSLRQFIEDNWSEDADRNGPYFHISDATKDQLRPLMLELVLGTEGERKVKLSASYVVTKMAAHDFPDKWPNLLPSILGVMPTGTDAQLHGALVVLQDLVADAFAGEQFFGRARDIISACYEVATNENRKYNHRALGVLVFRGCWDILDIVKGEYKKEVKAFAEECLGTWLPFFQRIIKSPLPERSPDEDSQHDSWYGPIALKTQVIKILIRIKTVFSALLLRQSPAFFAATWEELLKLVPSYQQLFIDSDSQGRLEDVDGLPFTLDFLVLDELDFLNQCLRAIPVQKELESQLSAAGGEAHKTPWLWDLVGMLVSYSQITQEEEGLWDIDVSLYLAEETSVSSNYTARTACGDLLIKVGEWLKVRALEGLFAWTKSLFTEPNVSWRKQEAALYLFNMLVGDLQDCDKPVPSEICAAYLELVQYAVSRQEEPILRARGYLVAGVLSRSFPPASALLDRAIEAMTREPSELVQVACVKAMEGFIKAGVTPERQGAVILAIQQFLEAKDLTELEDADDLLLTLLETLRCAINMDIRIAIQPDNKAIDLLFLIAKHGASNFNVALVVCEAFEEVVRPLTDSASYTALCTKVLPSLLGAFDVANVIEDDPLVTHGSEPLPAGFVASTLPKLNRLLMNSNEGEVLRPGAETVKWMLMHDHHQVFGWHDENGRSGLETCLHVIDRLLGPQMEENAASEVGGLAAELVEKAGQERLGPFLPQLLQAVASRLATAEAAAFIQSLILVFARLSLVGAQDVVTFLSEIQIGGQSGLHVVLSKWLENSIMFAGYDEIRQNVIALSKLYSLNDPRLAQTQVKGDLIIKPDDGRIMTRSRAREYPDQYTIIPATLKILKVLIEELSSASGTQGASLVAAAAIAGDEFYDDDAADGWEDDDGDGDTIDLSLNRSKRDLMSMFEVNNAAARQRDDETQAYLADFFLRAARENTADFKYWYDLLSEDEKGKLNELAAAQQQ